MQAVAFGPTLLDPVGHAVQMRSCVALGGFATPLLTYVLLPHVCQVVHAVLLVPVLNIPPAQAKQE